MRLYLYKHPVLGRATLPTPLMMCGAGLEHLNEYIFSLYLATTCRATTATSHQSKRASCYDAYSWDNMLLVEQALVAIEEDGRSDLDKSDQPWWRAHRHGCFIAMKSPPIARVDNVVYFNDIFVVAGWH